MEWIKQLGEVIMMIAAHFSKPMMGYILGGTSVQIFQEKNR
jgi:hypothetical protein